MRTIFKLIFLFNTVLLMAGGGPSSNIRIVNLSGEDISFRIAFNSSLKNNENIYTNLKDGRYNLSVSATEPHPYVEILFTYNEYHLVDMFSFVNTFVNSLEILDKRNKLIFNKWTFINKRGLVFARYSYWDEDYEYNPYGDYCILVLKTDLDRGGLQSSHRTTERLNLRESPSTKAPVKKVIDKGEAVAVTSIDEEYENGKYWVKIKLRDGTEGWGVATYLPIQ